MCSGGCRGLFVCKTASGRGAKLASIQQRRFEVAGNGVPAQQGEKWSAMTITREAAG
jgi:hypothetical protein